MSNTPDRIMAPVLDTAEGVIHGFFGRRGGVSKGLYASLNCGPGSEDQPEHVTDNRARVLAALEMTQGRLQTLYQVHGRTVVRVDGTESSDFRPQADGVVTAVPGVALGILTADCVPVLFADPVARVIGAAHAGWKGALAGIADVTLNKMIGMGAEREQIIAALGPSISAESYEVGPDFPSPFIASDASSKRFFRPSPQRDHHLFDLPGFVADRLSRAGIGTVERLRMDTCGDNDRFFSYRQSTHLGEPDYGRQLSVIAIPG